MKRRILGLIRFLLVGAILNVLVAWTCTLLVAPITKNMAYGSEQVWSKPPMYVHAVLYAGFGSEALGTFYSTAFQPNTTLAFVPRWIDLPEQLAIYHDAPLSDDFTVFHGSGWPCIAIWCRSSASPHASIDRSGIWRDGLPNKIPPQNLLFANPQRSVPLRPLWPGFAINTIFYAVLLWLPFAMIGVARRRRRAQRGRCIACGYDLRGCPPESIACPECGAIGSR